MSEKENLPAPVRQIHVVEQKQSVEEKQEEALDWMMLRQAAWSLYIGKSDEFPYPEMAAFIRNVAPRNEIERLLAVQMIGAHNAAMEFTRRAVNAPMPEISTPFSQIASKFMNVFLKQAEVLQKLKGGRR